MSTQDVPTEDEIRNITIRGVDIELYNEFTNKLREKNLTIGEAFNKMINDILNDFDQVFSDTESIDYEEYRRRLPRLSIGNHDQLEVSADDILTTKSQISFHNIENLKFDLSVTKEIALRHIKVITNCEMVQFPANFPKLIALAHCVNCEAVTFSD